MNKISIHVPEGVEDISKVCWIADEVSDKSLMSEIINSLTKRKIELSHEFDYMLEIESKAEIVVMLMVTVLCIVCTMAVGMDGLTGIFIGCCILTSLAVVLFTSIYLNYMLSTKGILQRGFRISADKINMDRIMNDTYEIAKNVDEPLCIRRKLSYDIKITLFNKEEAIIELWCEDRDDNFKIDSIYYDVAEEDKRYVEIGKIITWRFIYKKNNILHLRKSDCVDIKSIRQTLTDGVSPKHKVRNRRGVC